MIEPYNAGDCHATHKKGAVFSRRQITQVGLPDSNVKSENDTLNDISKTSLTCDIYEANIQSSEIDVVNEVVDLPDDLQSLSELSRRRATESHFHDKEKEMVDNLPHTGKIDGPTSPIPDYPRTLAFTSAILRQAQQKLLRESLRKNKS